MKRALVLSGGGSRGAYQFGVYKALRKMRIKIDIVTGTSIGALNGCLIVQKKYKDGIKLWENLSFSNVFDEPIESDYTTFDIFTKYIKSYIKKGGMDVSALERLIKSCVSLDKFYLSKIDFGLVTFRLNTLTPILLKKNEINKDNLLDYLIASSTCYPAFKSKKIGDDTYIDGGYYDNLPINLAYDMGADEVIAVNLNTIGINKKTKNKKNITYITPNNKLGNFLIFDSKEAKRQIRLGYNDTLKKYNKLHGIKYSFSHFTYIYMNLIYSKKYLKNILKYISPKTKIGNLINNVIQKNQDYSIIFIMDYLAGIFKLDETLIYNPWKFNSLIKKEFLKIPDINLKDIKSLIKEVKIPHIIEPKKIIKYIYYLTYNNKINELNTMSSLFPKEFMSAMYLRTIKRHIF